MQCEICGSEMIPVLSGDSSIPVMRCPDDGCYWASKERCVICGNLTSVKVGDHIDGRECYHEGVGQLCGQCEFNLYRKGR